MYLLLIIINYYTTVSIYIIDINTTLALIHIRPEFSTGNFQVLSEQQNQDLLTIVL